MQPLPKILLALLCLALNAGAAEPVKVYFSPGGGCTKAVVEVLENAKSSVYVQAYSFTSQPIARALTDAHKRGVKVAVILDRSNQTDKYSAATFLTDYGVPTTIDAQHAIAHNKVMIVDKHVVITGSFNFTKAAEQNNAENLLVIDDPSLAAEYQANWNQHYKHSEHYHANAKAKGKAHPWYDIFHFR